MKIKFIYFIALGIALMGCAKEKDDPKDTDNGTIKLSGVYLAYEAGSNSVWYFMSGGNSIMRQRTTLLGTGFTLQELINDKEVYFHDQHSVEHPPVTLNSKQRLRMVYYDKGSNVKLYWRVYPKAGAWHLGLKEVTGGLSKEMLQDPTYWFIFHLFTDDYYEKGQTAVVIESVDQRGQYVANEGHYSTGTNWVRLMPRSSPEEAEKFYITNP